MKTEEPQETCWQNLRRDAVLHLSGICDFQGSRPKGELPHTPHRSGLPSLLTHDHFPSNMAGDAEPCGKAPAHLVVSWWWGWVGDWIDDLRGVFQLEDRIEE